jgi:AraC-like DNA-binding protein
MPKTDADKSEYELKLIEGGVLARRKTKNSDGLHFFEDEFEVKDFLTANVITCQGWLLELIELKSGELFFQKGAETVRPNSKKFGVFYPSFTFTRPCFQNAKGTVIGIAGRNQLQTKFTVPIVFETNVLESPQNIKGTENFLNSIQNFQTVESNPKASLISVKAKRLIDENYQIYPSIARIAGRLKVTHAHLTRQFKHDYGMSPNKYLHQLRIADAAFRLSQGEEIIDVSGEVGYNDLSRFYKQFRQNTRNSPKNCQTKVTSKNAKTFA